MVELGEANVREFEHILEEAMPPSEYAEFINDYENGKFIYICNSFVMPRSKFGEFCKKIFKVMIPVAERMEGKSGVKDHRPCAGCFAEAVTSFYLKKMFRSIYTSPFLIYPLYKRYIADDLLSLDPLIFGSIIENGKEIFLPLGECPPKGSGERVSTSRNDTTYRVSNMLKTQGYLVR